MRGVTVLVLIAGVLAAATADARPETDSRAAAYDEFRALFAAGRYADALPYAERVVEQTAPGEPADPDLPQALNDLAATQLRLGILDDAEVNYWKSLELLQQSLGISSPRVIEPIAALAAIFAEQNRHAGAAEFYRQAVGISRRTQGLFNLAQLELLDGLGASYVAVGDYAGVELVRRYAVQIVEQNYGPDDPRVAPALLRLAAYYESRHDYVAARAEYERIAEITPNADTSYATMRIEALLGIGRMHRMQFTHDPESILGQFASVSQVMMRPVESLQSEAAKLAQEGHEALQSALRLLDGMQAPPVSLRLRTLLELGDWFTAARLPRTALSYYSRAATTFAQSPNQNEPDPLAAPRLVVYRPPLAAIRYRDVPPAQAIARPARFVLTVTRKGEPRDIDLASSEMTEMQSKHVRRALEQALYSPRFENGQPAKTEGVEFTDHWFELAPGNGLDSKPPSTGG